MKNMARNNRGGGGGQQFVRILTGEVRNRAMETLGHMLGGQINPKLLDRLVSRLSDWVEPGQLMTVLSLVMAVPLSGVRFLGSRYSSELGKESSDLLEGALERIIRGVTFEAAAFQRMTPAQKEERLMALADGKGPPQAQNGGAPTAIKVMPGLGFRNALAHQEWDYRSGRAPHLRSGYDDAKINEIMSELNKSPAVLGLIAQTSSQQFDPDEVRTVVLVDKALLIDSVTKFLSGKVKKKTWLDEMQSKATSVLDQGVHPDTARSAEANFTAMTGEVAEYGGALGRALDRAPLVHTPSQVTAPPGTIAAVRQNGVGQILLLVGIALVVLVTYSALSGG